jgi:fructose-1,6-bisphosphatase
MLSNSEREKVVIDLYNQGKNTREIAKKLRISFRDIGAIVRKAAASAESENSNMQQQHQQSADVSSIGKVKDVVVKATQAYKLFSEGKDPVKVAIELGVGEKQTSRFFKE